MPQDPRGGRMRPTASDANLLDANATEKSQAVPGRAARHQRFLSLGSMRSRTQLEGRLAQYPRLAHFFVVPKSQESGSSGVFSPPSPRTHDAEAGTPHDEPEGFRLLLNSSIPAVEAVRGAPVGGLSVPLQGDAPAATTGTVVSSIISLVNTIIGAGVLGVPYAMASCGYVLGTALLVLSAAATWFTMRLLVYAAAHTPGRESTFGSIAQMTVPKLEWFADAAVVVNSMGTMISYMMAVGDGLPRFLVAVEQLQGQDEPRDWIALRSWFISGCAVLLLPFSLSTYIDNLVYFSALALSCSLYLCVLCVYTFCTLPAASRPPPNELRAVRLDWSLFDILPILTFAFVCHPNVFAVYNELRDVTPGSLSSIMSRSVGASCVIYIAVGLSGYLAFGDQVASDIFGSYDNNAGVALGRLALVALLFFSFPLYVHPCRQSLENMAVSASEWWKRQRLGGASSAAYEPVDGSLALPRAVEPSFWRRCIATTLAIAVSWAVSVAVTSLDAVLTLAGATGATLVSYVLPPIFFLVLTQRRRPQHALERGLCWALIAASLVNAVGCAVFALD